MFHILHHSVKTKFGYFIQVGQLLEPVYSVTLKQLLDYITEETVLLKVDTEGSECRVRFKKKIQ